MKENLENIDQLFKDSLSHFTETPPAHLWNAVQAKTAVSQTGAKIIAKKGISLFGKWAIGAASVAVAATTVYLISGNSNQNPKNEVLSKNEIQYSQPKSDTIEAPYREMPANDLKNPIKIEEEIGSPVNREFQSSIIPNKINPSQNNDFVPTVLNSEFKLAKTETNDLKLTSENPMDKPISVKPNYKLLWKVETADVGENAKFFSVVSELKLASVVLYFGDGKMAKLLEQQNPFVTHEYFVPSTKMFKTKIVVNFADGVRDSQFVNVTVNPIMPVGEVMIPDIFTPNGDGTNDKYYVNLPKPEAFEMLVMDQRNRQIFNTLNIAEGWDGKCGKDPCENGEYQVIIKTKYSGESEKVSYKKIRLKTNAN